MGTLNCVECVLTVYILLGWLVAYGILKNIDNAGFKLYIFLMDRIEPVLSVIRRVIPPLFGLDFSTLIVFFAIHIIKLIIVHIFRLF